MRVSQCVGCRAFACPDAEHECYVEPGVNVKSEMMSIAMVSETAPDNADDYYYAKGDPLFQRTTVQAFNKAGAGVSSVKDIVDRGFAPLEGAGPDPPAAGEPRGQTPLSYPEC